MGFTPERNLPWTGHFFFHSAPGGLRVFRYGFIFRPANMAGGGSKSELPGTGYECSLFTDIAGGTHGVLRFKVCFSGKWAPWMPGRCSYSLTPILTIFCAWLCGSQPTARYVALGERWQQATISCGVSARKTCPDTILQLITCLC